VRGKFTYGEVAIPGRWLMMRHKGINEKPLSDDQGRPYGPFVIY